VQNNVLEMGEDMNRIAFVMAAMIVELSAAAFAGTIHGKVSGVNGESVVYVEAVAGKTFPAPSVTITIDQKRLMFAPHIAVVQQGGTVEFINSDSVAHNVFWPSVGGNKKLTHNLGTWPKGEKKAFKFDNAGVVPLLCNVHPEMAAYLIVSPTPYFATTNQDGEFKIENVPDGAYTVTAWHEGAKSKSNPVKVAGDTAADFTLSK
jgi:plastocyanin